MYYTRRNKDEHYEPVPTDNPKPEPEPNRVTPNTQRNLEAGEEAAVYCPPSGTIQQQIPVPSETTQQQIPVPSETTQQQIPVSSGTAQQQIPVPL